MKQANNQTGSFFASWCFDHKIKEKKWQWWDFPAKMIFRNSCKKYFFCKSPLLPFFHWNYFPSMYITLIAPRCYICVILRRTHFTCGLERSSSVVKFASSQGARWWRASSGKWSPASWSCLGLNLDFDLIPVRSGHLKVEVLWVLSSTF